MLVPYRNGDVGAGPRTFPVKACCRAGLGQVLVGLLQGGIGTGFNRSVKKRASRDGTVRDRAECGMDHRLTCGILKTRNYNLHFRLHMKK